jgi:hypothetical protein
VAVEEEVEDAFMLLDLLKMEMMVLTVVLHTIVLPEVVEAII